MEAGGGTKELTEIRIPNSFSTTTTPRAAVPHTGEHRQFSPLLWPSASSAGFTPGQLRTVPPIHTPAQLAGEGYTPPATQPDTPVPVGIGPAVTPLSAGSSTSSGGSPEQASAGNVQRPPATPGGAAAPRQLSPRTLRRIVGKEKRAEVGAPIGTSSDEEGGRPQAMLMALTRSTSAGGGNPRAAAAAAATATATAATADTELHGVSFDDAVDVVTAAAAAAGPTPNPTILERG